MEQPAKAIARWWCHKWEVIHRIALIHWTPCFAGAGPARVVVTRAPKRIRHAIPSVLFELSTSLDRRHGCVQVVLPAIREPRQVRQTSAPNRVGESTRDVKKWHMMHTWVAVRRVLLKDDRRVGCATSANPFGRPSVVHVFPNADNAKGIR
jgi:hypothetical protein